MKKCCKNCDRVFERYTGQLVCCSAYSSGNPTVNPLDSCPQWKATETKYPAGYRKAEEVGK